MTATPVEDDHGGLLPTAFELDQNYPNPFNPETRIRYSLAHPGRVTITVYNLLGQHITTLADELQAAGSHAVEWNGTDQYGETVASGVYFYRLKIGDLSQVKKMILLK